MLNEAQNVAKIVIEQKESTDEPSAVKSSMNVENDPQSNRGYHGNRQQYGYNLNIGRKADHEVQSYETNTLPLVYYYT